MIQVTKAKVPSFNLQSALATIKKNKVMVSLFPCSGPEKIVKATQNAGLIKQFKIVPAMITKIDNEVRNYGK